jgi:transcription initiation factor TFIID subunit TAF12
MSYNDQVKVYQEIRRQITDHANLLPKDTTAFYQYLLKINSLINKLPNDIGYRKNRIKSNTNNLMQLVDQLKVELQYLQNDCDMQIQRLIMLANRQSKEDKNARKSNA